MTTFRSNSSSTHAHASIRREPVLKPHRSHHEKQLQRLRVVCGVFGMCLVVAAILGLSLT